MTINLWEVVAWAVATAMVVAAVALAAAMCKECTSIQGTTYSTCT